MNELVITGGLVTNIVGCYSLRERVWQNPVTFHQFCISNVFLFRMFYENHRNKKNPKNDLPSTFSKTIADMIKATINSEKHDATVYIKIEK